MGVLTKLVGSVVLIAGLFSTREVYAAKDISQCSRLTPRLTSPTSIKDLRADDIKVFMALGDSITAGFGAKGIQNNRLISIKSLYENRGVSYAVGGDPGETTIPNLFGHYNTTARGPSVGDHLVELCYGPLCPPFQYRPAKDNLNAAQSGALSTNLGTEIDYLLSRIKNYPGIDIQNDWKLLTLQLGSNDMCQACLDAFQYSGPDAYEKNIRKAIDRVRKDIPKVIISLGGVFNVSQTWAKTRSDPYCQKIKGLPHLNIECPCALLGGKLGEESRKDMDNRAAAFNERLYKIYQDYKSQQSDTFALTLHPLDIDLASLPIDYLSNIDCFHPSRKAHAYIAKGLWNNFWIPFEQRRKTWSFNPDMEVYCPNESDRIRL
ncbi:hypothetical protein K7432_005237 [Basidiobolus ranarum]|uniref:Uncharacterized protein n=1 Tax=Basidiobolus ranarum TaxID=34480 RepID=A0ABR2WWX4_9FUNG